MFSFCCLNIWILKPVFQLNTLTPTPIDLILCDSFRKNLLFKDLTPEKMKIIRKKVLFLSNSYCNIVMLSNLQYYGAWSNYHSAINYLCKDQKYRIQAGNIAKERGLLPVAKKTESGRRSKVRHVGIVVFTVAVRKKLCMCLK